MLHGKLSPNARALCVMVGLAALLLIWEGLIDLGIVSDLLLPRPMEVLYALIKLFRAPSFWLDLSSTVWTWMAGVIVGTLAGGIIGLLLGLNPYIWAAVEPWVEFLRSLPSIVLIPLVSIFLGVSSGSRFASACLVVFLLMVSSAAAAVHATRQSYLRLAKAWRIKSLDVLKFFYIPATLSYQLIALKAAIPLALVITVAADMLVATESGLGRILMDSLAVFDTKKLYAGVLVVGILGYLAAGLSALLERKAIHWKNA